MLAFSDLRKTCVCTYCSCNWSYEVKTLRPCAAIKTASTSIPLIQRRKSRRLALREIAADHLLVLIIIATLTKRVLVSDPVNLAAVG